MHCKACNSFLSDFESTRRNKYTHDFVDLCNQCFKEVKDVIPVIERKDLMTSMVFDEDLSTEGTLEVYNELRSYINELNIND